VHGEVVDRDAAGFGDILGTRAGLRVEKSGNVTDLHASPYDLHDAIAAETEAITG